MPVCSHALLDERHTQARCHKKVQFTYHVQDVLLHALPLRETAGPVIAGAAARGRQEDVLRVEKVFDVRVLDAIDDPASESFCVSTLRVPCVPATLRNTLPA